MLARALAPLRRLPPAAVLGLGWAVVLLYAFPGLMTQDSLDHMQEARDGLYSDAHPPIINLIWKICEYLIAGPFGMLLLQTGLLLCGLYYVFRNLLEPRPAAWVAIAVYVFPPVMLPMAVIWKDCLMAGFLALGLAGLLSARRGPQLWGLVAMFLATAVRYNALGATLPLTVLLFQWRPGLHWLRRYAVSTAAWLAVTLAAFWANSALTDRKMHYWQSSLALYDIVGTLAYVDEDLPDEDLRELLAGTELLTQRDIQATARALYSTLNFYPIVADPERRMWDVPIRGYTPAPQSQRDAISRAWWDTVTRYPGAYARHRISVLAEIVGLGEHPAASAVTTRDFAMPEYAAHQGLSTRWSGLQQRLSKLMRRLERRTPLHVPYVYLIAALALLPLAVRQRDALALLLSGLSMEGTLLFLGHSSDYRYSHWMILCTIVAAIVLGTRRYRGRAEC